MSSTNFITGLGNSSKPSSKVLRPPGGGNSQLFGDDVPNTPRSVKNHMASNIFGSEQNASVKQNGDSNRRGQSKTDSYTRLFGEPERNFTPAKNHMKSSIPIGGTGAAGTANGSSSVSLSSSSSNNGVETNGHKNGNGIHHHHHQNGNGTNGTSSASSSARNGKMENGGGSSCASSEYQNGVSRTDHKNQISSETLITLIKPNIPNLNEEKEFTFDPNTPQSSRSNRSAVAVDQIKLDLCNDNNPIADQTNETVSLPEPDTPRSHLLSAPSSAHTNDQNQATTLSPKLTGRKGGNDSSRQSYRQPNNADYQYKQQRYGDSENMNSIREDEMIGKTNTSSAQHQQLANHMDSTISGRTHSARYPQTAMPQSPAKNRYVEAAATGGGLSYGIINMENAFTKSPRRDFNTCRNPVTGTGFGDEYLFSKSNSRRCLNQRKDAMIEVLNEADNIETPVTSPGTSGGTKRNHEAIKISFRPAVSSAATTRTNESMEIDNDYDVTANVDAIDTSFIDIATPSPTGGERSPSPSTKTIKIPSSVPSRYGLINMCNARTKSPRRHFDLCRNPVVGTNVSTINNMRSVRILHKDGNPVTGEGYKGAEINTSIPSLNGANQVINKNRIPPGGYSSGLW